MNNSYKLYNYGKKSYLTPQKLALIFKEEMKKEAKEKKNDKN